MEFGFTEEQRQLQREASGFFKKEVTEEVLRDTEAGHDLGAAGRELLLKMGRKGWVAPTWPKEYGGLGSSNVDRQIIVEERVYHGGQWILHGADIAGPVILRFGTDKQKREYLPRIARGEIEFAVGYTEPEAGSDLASVEMRAVKNGNEYVLNGQKTFNTFCHFADYHWVLARTAFDVPRHRGMSLFVVDLKTPGITVRPLWTIAGWRTNEVFYDDVRVPASALIGGEENKGWRQLMTALGFERMYPVSDLRRSFEQLLQYAKEARFDGLTLADQPVIRQKLGRLAIELEVARLLLFRAAWMMDQGLSPEHETSMVKVFVTELWQHLYGTAMQMMGLYGRLREGSRWAPLMGKIEHHYRWSVTATVSGGTNEIHRNVIAVRGLGLPVG